MSYIEAASIHDAPALEAITFASKSHWGYRPGIMEAWGKSYKGPSFEAFQEGRVQVSRKCQGADIIGYYALGAPDNNTIRMTHLFVEPSHIGSGRGDELFKAATQQAQDLGCTVLKIISDPEAEGFYLHHGATRTGALSYPGIPDYSSPILELDLTFLPGSN